MRIGFSNERVEHRRKSTEHEPESLEGPLIVRDSVEIELRISLGVRSSRIHQTERGAVEEGAPPRRPADSMCDTRAPQQLERLAPAGDDEHDRLAADLKGGDEHPAIELDVARCGEAHHPD